MSFFNSKPVVQANSVYGRYLMWSLPLAFFTYQFILRLWPSLMMEQIMRQFMIDATSFGFLASAYYYGYAGMQIPLAMALNRYGSRYVLFACALLCGLATLMFTLTDSWIVALASRFFIGVGSAAGFLATSAIVSQWFPKEWYGSMIGFSFSVGLMGAIYGGKPIGLLVAEWGWEPVAVVLGGVSVLIGLLSVFFLRSPTGGEETDDKPQAIKLADLRKLLTSPALLLLAVANLLMVGALEGFADVWGTNYLMVAYGVSKVDGAELVSFIFVGMLFGGPLLAYLSKWGGNYGVMSLCGVGIALIFTYLLLLHDSPETYRLGVLFFVIGLLCCYQVLMFSAAADLVPSQLLGISVAFLNCINMLGGSFFHSVIGYIMDYHWKGLVIEGIRSYTVNSYMYALLFIPICACVGACLILSVRWQARKSL